MKYNIIYLENLMGYLLLSDKEFDEIVLDYSCESLVQRNMPLVDAVKLKKVLEALV